MKDSRITDILDLAIAQVDAIDTLGASLAAGLHVGVITHDHVQILINMISTHTRGQLEELRAEIDGGSL